MAVNKLIATTLAAIATFKPEIVKKDKGRKNRYYKKINCRIKRPKRK
jgi:hypothetical protein